MCGIFGVLEHDTHTVPDERMLEASARLLAHRGPDNLGVYRAPGIGLAHTRLSLLDLSPRGNQPFWDASGRYAIVYNGEIYNFKTLRADLERSGVHFRSDCDTEVLIESIARRGLAETLPKLEGMYAFGLYDKSDQSLTLVRDPFGIKPLYVFEDSQSFLFSSEIRAMLPWRKFDLDTLRAAGYLLDIASAFTCGFTLLKDVKIVAPGSITRVKPGLTSQASRFFNLSDLWEPEEQEALRQLKVDALIDRVEAALLAAVKTQEMADAPVGALCSGGVDSSLTVAMASRVQSNIQIFHANSPGKGSEMPYAAAIARHLGLELQAVDVVDQDHIDLLPETILHRGSPFLDTFTSLPFLKLSRLVRERGVKGVLTGEASDEIFWGYDRMVPNLERRLRQLPGRGARFASRPLRRLLGRDRQPPQTGFLQAGTALFSRFEIELEAHEVKEAILAQGKGPVDARDLQSLLELNRNLRPLLSRNDACGMASSIESRFPFLDLNVVKLAVNLPKRHKVHYALRAPDRAHPFVVDKWILRRVADRYMPRTLSRRQKVPWPTSAPHRMEIHRGFFANSFARDLFGFSGSELDFLMKNGHRILKLKLLHLDVWAQMFLHGATPESMVQKLRTHVAVTPE